MGLNLSELTAFAVLGAAMLSPFLISWLAERHAKRAPLRRLQRDIFENLDNALMGGQFDAPDGYCYGMTAEELAYDLTRYAAGFEEFTTLNLLPYVREWMKLRGLKWHTA